MQWVAGPMYARSHEINSSLFIADGLLWTSIIDEKAARSGTKVHRMGLDPLTGETVREVREVSAPKLKSPGHHPRCYVSKATERYLMLNKRGIEYLDLIGDNHMRTDWLQASTGKLVWRFRAAPTRRQILVYDQLESTWPVHGSVLLQHDRISGKPLVYVTAGRSSYLDGGIYVYALDPLAGKVIYQTQLDGLIAAEGRLFMSCKNGVVLCLGN